jgi:hypothetical protein
MSIFQIATKGDPTPIKDLLFNQVKIKCSLVQV